jgi:hypothetical protein
MNHVIVLTLFILFLVGIFSVYPEIIFAKHEEEQKSDSDSGKQSVPNNDQTTPTDDNKQSDVIPIEPTTPIPTIAASQTCSNGSDKTNDKICVESAANQEQAVSQPQNTPTPQSNPIVNTNPSNNPSTTTPTTTKNNNVDNQQDSSGGSTGSSSSDEQSTDEDKKLFSDKNLGSESHFVVMSQDKGVGLYRIVSDETDLDTGILPQTIRLVHTFESAGEAMSWLSDYDDNN